MIRGRRAVSAAGISILILGLFYLLPNVKAQQLSTQLTVTASVLLSDLWKNALSKNSLVDYKLQNQRIFFKVTSLGPDNQLPSPTQKILMKVYFNDQEIASIDGQLQNPVQFQYPLFTDGLYRFTFFNHTYDQEIELAKKVSFFYSTLFHTPLSL